MKTFRYPFSTLTDRARAQSRRQILAEHPEPDATGLWLFSYGSLMWKPDFIPARTTVCRLDNWSRSFSIWTTLARGSLEQPGLGLGLVPGGSTDGIAYYIEAGDYEVILPRIWEREMWTDAYLPVWQSLTIEDKPQATLTFVTNPDSPQCASELTDEEIATYIRNAVGEKGSCLEYFQNTEAKLKDMQIVDQRIHALANLLMR